MTAVSPVVALARIVPDLVDNAVQLLTETQLERFCIFVEELDALVRNARTTPPENNTQAHTLANSLGVAATAFRELEALRRSRLIPLEAEVNGINDLFRPVTTRLQSYIDQGKAQTLAYQAAERARAQREEQERQRRLQEAAEAEAAALAKAQEAATPAGREDALVEAEQASRTQAIVEAARVEPALRGFRSELGSTSERGRWVLLGVSDYDAVPPVYWQDAKVLDALHKALQRAITAGVRDIPGCSIGREETLTVRAR